MNQGIVPSSNGMVSDETLTHYADFVIEILDDDFSPENAAQAFADVIAIGETSKWVVGDIMVHVRMRFGKELIGKADNFTAAKKILEEKFRVEEQEGEAIDVLDWKIYCYPSYWILENVYNGTCRMWQVTENYLDERGFNRWVSEACHTHVNQLSNNWKTTATRYRTSLAWPRPKRQEAWSWSAHAELAHLSGGRLDAGNGRGLLRLADKAKQIEDTVKSIEEKGPVTLGRIRKEYSNRADEARGYFFLPPMPRYLYIHNAKGESIMVLSFVDLDAEGAYSPDIAIAQIWILQAAGVVSSHASLRLGFLEPGRLVVDNDLHTFKMNDGRLVAVSANRDDPLARKAMEDLVTTMRL